VSLCEDETASSLLCSLSKETDRVVIGSSHYTGSDETLNDSFRHRFEVV